MNKLTLKALQGSIAKWKAIEAGSGVDDGVNNCPLCAAFYRQPDRCYACPVRSHTGLRGCAGSPYFEWLDHHEDEHSRDFHPFSITAGCKTCVRLARAERKFLESLLPQQEAK